MKAQKQVKGYIVVENTFVLLELSKQTATDLAIVLK